MEKAKELIGKFSEQIEKWERDLTTEDWEKDLEEIYSFFSQLCENSLFGECMRILGLLQTAQQHGKEIDWDKIITALNSTFVKLPKSEREILFPVYIKLGERAVTPLLNLLKDVEAKDLRIQIIEILKNIFARHTDILPRLLDTTNEPWYLVRNLILIAGEIGTEDLAQHLERFTGYDNEKVKKELAEALIKIKGINSVQYLTKLIIDKNPVVRRSVVESLLRHQLWSSVASENILFALRNAMDRINDEKEEQFVRVSVSYLTNALPHLNNPERALKSLVTLVKKYGKKGLIPGKKTKQQIGVLSTLLNSLAAVDREKLKSILPLLESATSVRELQEIISKLKS